MVAPSPPRTAADQRIRCLFAGHPDAILFLRMSQEGAFNSRACSRQLTGFVSRCGFSFCTLNIFETAYRPTFFRVHSNLYKSHTRRES